jgi:hypothetical protein
MNIRDFIFINKAKSTDRIKILELLGFETETIITQAPENYLDADEVQEVNNFNIYDDVKDIKRDVPQQSSVEAYITETEKIYSSNTTEESDSLELPTETFNDAVNNKYHSNNGYSYSNYYFYFEKCCPRRGNRN